MNITDKLLVHLVLDDKDSVRVESKKKSALICNKILISPSNNSLPHYNLSIQLVDTIFSNTEEKSFILKNIEGVIPFNDHKLLVTLLFCNNYYEVICDAIVANAEKFILCNPCIASPLLPADKYNLSDIEYIFMANEIIPKLKTPSECHKFVLNKIINIACNAIYRRNGPSYYANDPNIDIKAKAYYSCQIHSIEVLKELLPPKLKNLDYYLNSINKYRYSRSEETIVYETVTQGFSLYNNQLYFNVNREDKYVYFHNSRDGIKRVRDSDSYNGFGYDEVTINYSIFSKKQFQTQFLLELYVEYLFFKCNCHNISTSKERDINTFHFKEEQFILSNISMSLREIENLFEIYFVESYI